MITTLVICGVAVLTISMVALVARGEATAVNSADELLAALYPVDLEAFRNLTDPREEDFLRAHLPPGEFRSVQRRRLRATLDYVSRTAHNAAVLLRLGEAGRSSHDPRIVHAADELANAAIQLRFNCLLAIALVYVRMAAPGSELRVSRLLGNYERVREATLRLSRLRMPAAASRIEAVL